MSIRRKTPLPPRTSPIRRSAVKRSQKRIPQINVERAKRRQEAYQAYLRSPEWREKKRLVRQRSGGRCERIIILHDIDGHETRMYRCHEAATVVNHLRYQRFTKENLSDLEDLCKLHNEE